MESAAPISKREPGVYQGTPDISQSSTTESVASRLIHTMKSDSAEAIKKQNETSVSIAIAEEKKLAQARAEAETKKQEEGNIVPPAPKRVPRMFIILGLVLIIAALVATYIFIIPRLKKIPLPTLSIPTFSKPTRPALTPAVPQIKPLAPSFIPAQAEKLFNISKETPDQVFATIDTERNLGLPTSSIKNLYFSEGIGTSTPVISALQLLTFANVSTPDIIARSLEKPFMAGFFGESDGAATPFLILKVSGYDTGLAGMLDWEPGLPRLFDAIFKAHVTGGPATAKFSDVVIGGKDARILETTSGVSVVYGFANPSTVVIAGSKTTLEAILQLAAKI